MQCNGLQVAIYRLYFAQSISKCSLKRSAGHEDAK